MKQSIVILKYNIEEYVKGNLLSNNSDLKEAKMKFTYQGIAEFSVDKGRWVTYDGIMSYETEVEGAMNENKKTIVSLISEKNASR